MTGLQKFLMLTSVALFLGGPALAQLETPDPAGGSADPDFVGNAGAVVVNGLTLVNAQDLDFGVIAPSLTQTGTVKVLRGRNLRSECSGELTCFAPGNRARYTVTGDPRRFYTISDPGQISISDGQGNSMLVNTFFGAGSGNDTQWRGLQRVRETGIQRFNVGAILHVNPNQPPGLYSGSFTLTVEYQ